MKTGKVTLATPLLEPREGRVIATEKEIKLFKKNLYCGSFCNLAFAATVMVTGAVVSVGGLFEKSSNGEAFSPRMNIGISIMGSGVVSLIVATGTLIASHRQINKFFATRR